MRITITMSDVSHEYTDDRTINVAPYLAVLHT